MTKKIFYSFFRNFAITGAALLSIGNGAIAGEPTVLTPWHPNYVEPRIEQSQFISPKPEWRIISDGREVARGDETVRRANSSSFQQASISPSSVFNRTQTSLKRPKTCIHAALLKTAPTDLGPPPCANADYLEFKSAGARVAIDLN